MQRVTDISTKLKSQNVQNAQEIRKITEKTLICTKFNSVRKKRYFCDRGLLVSLEALYISELVREPLLPSQSLFSKWNIGEEFIIYTVNCPVTHGCCTDKRSALVNCLGWGISRRFIPLLSHINTFCFLLGPFVYMKRKLLENTRYIE